MGVLLRGQQAAVREGGSEGKWEHEESGVRGLSGSCMWEGRVILNVGYEEMKTKTSDYNMI